MATSSEPDAGTVIEDVNAKRYVACALGVMVEGVKDVDENACTLLTEKQKTAMRNALRSILKCGLLLKKDMRYFMI